MYPKPVPPTNASSNTAATLPRSGTTEYVIGRIVEEEEGEELIARINAAKSRDAVAKRQSALMSSFEPATGDSLYYRQDMAAGNAGQGWSFRSVDPNNRATRSFGIADEHSVGIAM